MPLSSIATPPPLALDRTRALVFALLVIASCFVIGLVIYKTYGGHPHHYHPHYMRHL